MPNRYGPDTVVRRGAVVIIDQSNFTRKVMEQGPSVALRDVWLMRRLLVPLMREHGGEVYKIDADNLYVFFDRVEPAVVASMAAHREVRKATIRRKYQLAVCIGIGFGDLLYVTSEDDYYGREVNLASKLGEDVAESGETFLTEAALAAIQGPIPGSAGEIRRATVSGLKLKFRAWEE